jgi:hypothetical protein
MCTDVSEERIASIFRVEKITESAATRSSWFSARGFFYTEDEGEKLLRNVGSHKNYTALHPRRRHSK